MQPIIVVQPYEFSCLSSAGKNPGNALDFGFSLQIHQLTSYQIGLLVFPGAHNDVEYVIMHSRSFSIGTYYSYWVTLSVKS